MHHIEYEGLGCPVVDQDIRKSVNDEIQILKNIFLREDHT